MTSHEVLLATVHYRFDGFIALVHDLALVHHGVAAFAFTIYKKLKFLRMFFFALPNEFKVLEIRINPFLNLTSSPTTVTSFVNIGLLHNLFFGIENGNHKCFFACSATFWTRSEV